MATPYGEDTVTAVSRHFILPKITDNVYNNNLLLFRLNSANKKLIRGGLQLEVPLMYAEMSGGGPYSGFDQLDATPSDTIKNAAFDWRQYHQMVTIDGLTMIRTDSELAIANTIELFFDQAQMQMAEWLGRGIWSDGTDPKAIDGLEMAVDDSSVAPVYGGLARASNDFWKSQVDNSTSTLSGNALQSMFGACSEGGRHPTLIVSRQEQYDRFWGLNISGQEFPTGPGLVNDQLAQMGFHNLLFNGVPWVVDSHVFDGPDTSNSSIVFLNEDYLYFAVASRADFHLEDFVVPHNQDVMTAKLLWAGNLMSSNVSRQGKMTNISA